MTKRLGPRGIVWVVTYTCPLRCVHCYTESGRRPAAHPGRQGLFDIADQLIRMHPFEIALAGGEPLLVPGIYDVARRISAAGIDVSVWTSGWNTKPAMIHELISTFGPIHVSIDGSTAEVHDAIRGRRGSFDRALETLRLLDEASRERVARGGEPVIFGVDYVVTRGNYDQREDFVRRIAPRFPGLNFVTFESALPIGLASRDGFVQHELLSDDQAAAMASESAVAELAALAPAGVEISADDHRGAHPYLNGGNPETTFMELEPDGGVRAFPIYEGTVGNILTEPGEVLWQRALDRRLDPFVRETFAAVRTIEDWAVAVRRLDYHFGTDEVRARIDRRPEFLPLTPA
jgi:MoaA/NifB/PqqE/SkfB family radical SAM enzyme